MISDRPWGLWVDGERWSTYREIDSAVARAEQLLAKGRPAHITDERTGETMYTAGAVAEGGCALCGEPHLDGTCLL